MMKIELDDNTKVVLNKLVDKMFNTNRRTAIKMELRPDLSTKDQNKFKIILEVK